MSSGGIVVVTGATGHLGNVLVRELVAREIPVRAMTLPGDDVRALDGLDVERVDGDVRNPDQLRRAFADARVVFHLAGLISIRSGDDRVLEEVNVVGTQNVIQACESCGVERLVYMSSAHALEEPPRGTALTEACKVNPARVFGSYAKSKARATQCVMEAARRGLNACIAFPSGIVGPYDFGLSEMGRMILSFKYRRLPTYVEGAYNFVDVRDVATGAITIAEKGQKGEGYILSGEYLTVPAIMSLLQHLTGVKAPLFMVPYSVARVGAALAPLISRATGRAPQLTSYSLRVLRSNALMSSLKARVELGYHPRPLTQSFADTVAWFESAGM